MTDPRASTALRHLHLDDPPPGCWRWAVLEPEPSGRARLPPAALEVLSDGPSLRARVHGQALLLSANHGPGRRIGVDCRGRLYLPVWLRRPAVAVATSSAEGLVLVVDAVLLDPVGDRLLAEVRR